MKKSNLKKIFITSILVNICTSLLAQNSNILQSSGSVPSYFTDVSSEQYKKELELIKNDLKKSKRFERNVKKEFTLESTFSVKQFLYSGRVCFGDPVSVYINKVVDIILKDDPELRSKLQFYTIRSTDVNAFATHQGIILVNEALVAQAENEAQLAFILCHEITHYVKKHSIKATVTNAKIDKKRYSNDNNLKKLFAKSQFSQENESEADIEGLKLFAKTDYSANEISGSFDVLQFSYLPFDDIEWKADFFENGFKFPNDVFIKNINSIHGNVDSVDQEYSTHPILPKRRKYMNNAIINSKPKGTKSFILPESEFKLAQKTARYDLSNVYMLDGDFTNAIYNAYLLLKLYPNDITCKSVIAKSLYALARLSQEGKTDFKVNKEGESGSLEFFFDKLSVEALSSLAINYTWQLKNDFPFMKDYTRELIHNLYLNKELDLSYFLSSDDIKNNAKTSSKIDTSIVSTKISKYDKIKMKIAATDTVATETNFVKFMLVKVLNDNEFTTLFEEEVSKAKSINLAKNDKDLRKKKKKEAEKLRKKESKRGKALGIDKILVLSPSYRKIDIKQRDAKLDYLTQEVLEKDLVEYIQLESKNTGLQIEVINDESIANSDIQRYNDICFMHTWFIEKANQLDNKLVLQNLFPELVSSITSRYNTEYVNILGFSRKTHFKTVGNSIGIIIGSAFSFNPFGFYAAFRPSYETNYFSIVMNVKSNELIWVDEFRLKERDSKTLLKVVLWDRFSQIHAKKK